jgi:hypothetical protein
VQYLGASASVERPFCCSLRGMGDNFEVDVEGDLIVVWDPATHFYAIYAKPSDQPQLILKRRRPTKDHQLLARAWQAANDKARELGWIV